MSETIEEPVASARHTLVLSAILLLIAAAGWVSLIRATGDPVGSTPAGPLTYIALLSAEIGLLFYVRAGIRAKGVSLASLIGTAAPTARRLGLDVALGLLLLLSLLGLEWLLRRWMGTGDARQVQRLIVHRLADVPLWLLLSAAAGFVEEVTFRGYFQRQFGAWMRSPWAGLVAQALLFGITHGYQGPTLIARIAILGGALGLAAHWRRSLVPGIVAHFGLDVIGGISNLGFGAELLLRPVSRSRVAP